VSLERDRVLAVTWPMIYRFDTADGWTLRLGVYA
jgi:hypothetical protein